jgi:hypothetical protein
MTSNYDTRDHKVYKRIERIEIQYPASGLPTVIYTERSAAVLDGQVRFLDSEATPFNLEINSHEFDGRIQLVNPSTGEPIEGQTTSIQELLMGITAIIRTDQIRRDMKN